MPEIKTVGQLRDALKHSEDDEPLLFDLQDGNKKVLLKCAGVGSSGGGRITVIWLDMPETPNNYVI